MRDFLATVLRRLRGSQNPAASQAYLSLKHAYHAAARSRITFLTFEDLTRLTRAWEPSLPAADLIVAIPRSGLPVGSIIALRRGIPLATPDAGPWQSSLMGERAVRSILLVDDSVKSGESFAAARAQVAGRYPDAVIATAALIASRDSAGLADHAGVIIEPPRVFEWNFLHSKKFATAFDFDGVLCEDPEYGLAKDDARYRAWMKTAVPRFIPSYEIDAIVSNRPEHARKETEAWLREHGVRWKELYLAKGGETGEDRKFAHKVSVLRRVKPDWYIESDRSAAAAIAAATRIPVLSIADWKIYD
jgi:adenine/guanine phosphoribosyltransferase-like PRPP-binding protein